MVVVVYNFTSRETWKQRANKMREVVVVLCVGRGGLCAYLFFLFCLEQVNNSRRKSERF